MVIMLNLKLKIIENLVQMAHGNKISLFRFYLAEEADIEDKMIFKANLTLFRVYFILFSVML